MKLTDTDYELLITACCLLAMVSEGMMGIAVKECYKGVISPSDYELDFDRAARLISLRDELRNRLDRLNELQREL